MKIGLFNQHVQACLFRLSRALNRVASLSLFLMMLLTIMDVFLRKAFRSSILGTVEITEFMMVILVFLGLAWTELLDGHVRVDLIMSRFGQRVHALVDLITQLACSVLFGFITWSTLVYSINMKASREVSQDLWIPKYPFLYVAGAGCALLGLILFIQSLMAALKVIKSWNPSRSV